MGKIIQLPDQRKRESSPLDLYLRRKKREERSELAIFGVLGSCAAAGLLLGALKMLPTVETGQVKTNRIEHIEKLGEPQNDWARSPVPTNGRGARS